MQMELDKERGDMFRDIDVKKLIELLDASDIGVLQLKTKDFEFLLARDGVNINEFHVSSTETQLLLPESVKHDSSISGAPARNIADRVDPVEAAVPEPVASATEKGPQGDKPSSAAGLAIVEAPLVGVFYRASSPGAPPYVEIGQQVEPDTTIGLVETMKVFTAVRAGKRGIVREIFAGNGQVIESGDPLIAIEEN